MQALRITTHGPPDALHPSEVPVPAPGPGEVLVQVEAAGVNPSDVVSLQGRFPQAVLPRVLGRDFAGRVVDGPPDLRNSAVWGTGGDLGITRDGTHAGFIVLPAEAVSRRPRNLSAEQAAVVGVPALAAWSSLVETANVQPGEWVVVSGAAGGVGWVAVELAAARGAKVIALVKDAADAAQLDRTRLSAVARSDLGDLPAVVRQATGGRGVDVALNGVGSAIFESLFQSLARGGRLCVYSAAAGREVRLDLFDFYRRRLRLLRDRQRGGDRRRRGADPRPAPTALRVRSVATASLHRVLLARSGRSARTSRSREARRARWCCCRPADRQMQCRR